MAGLTGGELRKLLEHTDPRERLVVTPLLEPSEQLRDQQASLDVRLGFEFALVTPSSHGAIDEFEDRRPSTQGLGLEGLYRRQHVPSGRFLVIHPHQFILGMTLEYIRLPQNVLAYVIGRSTWGRLGLIVATAIGVHPGFAGSLILELRNLGETPLCLYPGQTIAQLFFHDARSGESDGDAMGQYSGVVDLVPRTASPRKTYKKLRSLKKRSTKGKLTKF